MPKLPNIKQALKDKTPRLQTEVYTKGHAYAHIWNALPSPVTTLYSLVMSGSLTGLCYYFGDRFGDGQGYRWSVICIAIMTVIGLTGTLFKSRRLKKEATAGTGHADGFTDAVKGSATGHLQGADPNEIARLDDLRKNFQKGIDAFAEYGKDIYSLPWYVVVGEPGSGKTEAIRRSELRFPDRLQDRLQGTGGTYSMHWWFTNNAIIIDTAGAMLTQPEAAERFEEFLTLLKKNRPDCPLNGMILTVPVDSLIIDPPHIAEEKAATIAAQLSIVQKALDVRFPIYLMISKSDRLPCFREYFDAPGQGAFEREMMGWSNPDPLGTAFDPHRIQDALDTIATRLRGRALALLADPIARNPGSRRADEVDALYAFPSHVRSLGPRLQRYLDIIFQGGTWATRPPFFRGLYFTSALREGSQLDDQLASALGLKVESLPSGGVFVREKSVFLRDMFLEKIFPEQGLVTRLTNIAGHMRRRLIVFYGATAALLALTLGWAWLIKSKLAKELETDQKSWLAVNRTWQNGTLLPILEKRPSIIAPPTATGAPAPLYPPAWGYTLREEVPAYPSVRASKTRLAALTDLHTRTAENMDFGWVFRPVAEWSDFEMRRRQAFLTTLENSTLKPLVDAARERMLWDAALGNKTTAEVQAAMAKAFGTLTKLQVWGTTPTLTTFTKDEWATILKDLTAYILHPDWPGGYPVANAPEAQSPGHLPLGWEEDLTALTALITTTYSTPGLPTRTWLTTGGHTDAIKTTAAFLFGRAAELSARNETQKRAFEERKTKARATYDRARLALLDMTKATYTTSREIAESKGLQPLRDAALVMDEIIKEDSGGTTSTVDSAILTETAIAIAAAEKLALDRKGQLPEALTPFRASIAKYEKAADIPTDQGPTTADQAKSWPQLATELKLFEKSFTALAPEEAGITMHDPIGNLGTLLTNAAEKAAAARPPDQQTPPEGETAQICTFLSGFRAAPLIDTILQRYRQTAQGLLVSQLRFPLVATKEAFKNFDELRAASKEIDKLEKDATDLAALTKPEYQGEALNNAKKEFFIPLQRVFSIKNALIKADKPKGGLTIQVAALQPSEEVPVIEPEEEPEPPPPATPNPQGGFFGIGGNTPPPPPQIKFPKPEKKIRVGIKNIRAQVGRQPAAINQAPPLPPNLLEIPYNGFDGFRLDITFFETGNQTGRDVTTAFEGNWQVLRAIAAFKNESFRIRGTTETLTILADPALPLDDWPRLQEFLPTTPPTQR